jgi:hypothetical protein
VPTTPKLKVAETPPDDLSSAPHQPPPLRSTEADRTAVRIDGLTYLLAPGAVKGFLARNTTHEGAQGG